MVILHSYVYQLDLPIDSMVIFQFAKCKRLPDVEFSDSVFRQEKKNTLIQGPHWHKLHDISLS